jgi:hypothetical protein
MRRRFRGRPICEMCCWIDIGLWHREGRLRPGQSFPNAWTCDGEPVGSITVAVEPRAVVLSFQVHNQLTDERAPVEQRVPVEWTRCHFGGGRPWFRCTASSEGHYCGRRVCKLYFLSSIFACRHCYGLSYATQLEPLRLRGLARARKIRMRLGGGPNMFDPFPSKPKGMHWRTYKRLRHLHDVAAARCGAA